MTAKSPENETGYALLPVPYGDAAREREFLALMHHGFHDGEMDFDELRTTYLKDKSRKHFLFQFNQAAIGAATLCEVNDTSATLTNVTIHPCFRNRHHGQALVRSVESLAASFGCVSIMLAAEYDKAEFYENLGYQHNGMIGYGVASLNRMFKIL